MENKIKRTQPRGVLMLLLTAFIWGSSFVAQSIGMESIGPFTFSAVRTAMGVVALLPVALIRLRRSRVNVRKTIRSGVVVGLVFTMASNLQQHAFAYSTPGKIAFITAFYMFLVPLFGLVSGKRLPWLTWVCVISGIGGLFLLTFNPSDPLSMNLGDALAFGCSVFFALHIILIDRYAEEVDGVLLSLTQFLVCSIISTVLMFLFEQPRIPAIRSALMPLLYSGVFSCSVAYTMQIVGQRYTESTVASLLMCMESVFAVLMAAVLLGQRLTGMELAGCTMMFIAIIMSQLSETLLDKRKAVAGEEPTAAGK